MKAKTATRQTQPCRHCGRPVQIGQRYREKFVRVPCDRGPVLKSTKQIRQVEHADKTDCTNSSEAA